MIRLEPKTFRKTYSGPIDVRFGPTLAAEHLAQEDGITVHHDTLRRWMVEAGLWSRARTRRAHRQRRVRKAHFRELVQLDGSFHEWYEGRGPRGCLVTLVDDATSHTLGRLGEEETTWAAADVLRQWIERYGVPHVLYTDWKNVYVRTATAEETATGAVPLTQFGRMCAALDIQIITASWPQAKARVERNHGTHQDRLVKKLRRLGIADATAANRFLAEYLPEHNRRFAVAPTSAEDFIGAVPTRRPSIGSSGSRTRASCPTTGSSATPRGTFKSRGRVSSRPRGAPCWCGRRGTARSNCGIGGA